jgi:hypothetical protein
MSLSLLASHTFSAWTGDLLVRYTSSISKLAVSDSHLPSPVCPDILLDSQIVDWCNTPAICKHPANHLVVSTASQHQGNTLQSRCQFSAVSVAHITRYVLCANDSLPAEPHSTHSSPPNEATARVVVACHCYAVTYNMHTCMDCSPIQIDTRGYMTPRWTCRC